MSSKVEQLIRNHQQAVKEQLLASLMCFLFGFVGVFLVPKALSIARAQKLDWQIVTISQLVGFSVPGGVGMIPTVEVLKRRERVRNLQALKALLASKISSNKPLNPDEQKAIDQIFIKLIEKIALG